MEKMNHLKPVKVEGENQGVFELKEVIFALALVAEKCKERFSDGIQYSDFLSLGKFLVLDGEFRDAAKNAIKDINELKDLILEFKVKNVLEIYKYCKDVVAELLKK